MNADELRQNITVQPPKLVEEDMPVEPVETNVGTEQLRQKLVEQLEHYGAIRSTLVKEAMSHVPRHIFVPHVPVDEAYEDKVIHHKIVDNELISSVSQPGVIAFMLEQLELEPGHRVLEIGAGSGYNAALMAHIVGEAGAVVTIDIDDDLVEGARENLDAVGFPQVKTICADGGHGYADDAPYDRIILTVSANDITLAWQEQLRVGGRLVLPFSLLNQEASIAFIKEEIDLSVVDEDNIIRLRSTSVKGCTFIDLRGEFAKTSTTDSDQKTSLDDDLRMVYGIEEGLESAQIYEWLQGAYDEQTTNTMVNFYGLIESLSPWISLHNLPVLRLEAENEMAARGLVPPLVEQEDGEHKWASTGGLVSAKGMALLSPPSYLVRASAGEPRERRNFFDLHVRAYGDDPDLAQKLVETCQAWRDADRPRLHNLGIYVYPKEAKVPDEAHQFMMEKSWSNLGLDLK